MCSFYVLAGWGADPAGRRRAAGQAPVRGRLRALGDHGRDVGPALDDASPSARPQAAWRPSASRPCSPPIARELDVPRLRLFETGGDAHEAERNQWDDGNNAPAIAPGVVVYERNVDTRSSRGERSRSTALALWIRVQAALGGPPRSAADMSR